MRKPGSISIVAEKPHCNAMTRVGRCRSGEGLQSVTWYPDGNREKFTLRFCEIHWLEREDYRPSTIEEGREAMRKLNELLAGTHILIAVCRDCKAVNQDDQAKMCDACGGFDLSPENVLLDVPRDVWIMQRLVKAKDAIRAKGQPPATEEF